MHRIYSQICINLSIIQNVSFYLPQANISKNIKDTEEEVSDKSYKINADDMLTLKLHIIKVTYAKNINI